MVKTSRQTACQGGVWPYELAPRMVARHPALAAADQACWQLHCSPNCLLLHRREMHMTPATYPTSTVVTTWAFPQPSSARTTTSSSSPVSRTHQTYSTTGPLNMPCVPLPRAAPLKPSALALVSPPLGVPMATLYLLPSLLCRYLPQPEVPCSFSN